MFSKPQRFLIPVFTLTEGLICVIASIEDNLDLFIRQCISFIKDLSTVAMNGYSWYG